MTRPPGLLVALRVIFPKSSRLLFGVEVIEMLHAEIRWADDVVHIFGEMDAYNLQTLRQHMAQVLCESRSVRVSIELSAQELPIFEQQTRRWMPQLKERGATVAVTVDSGCTSFARSH